MPALSNRTLFAKLRAALPPATRFETQPDAVRPCRAVIPGFGRARFYLWTVTADRSVPGARPPGEFKIQLIVEGQPRGARGSLEIEDAYTVVLGYSPDYGVFVGWESRIYVDFGYSANVQVRDSLLLDARNNGWAVAPPRSMKGTSEVRVAFSSGNLLHFLRVSREADNRQLRDVVREAFFLSKVPNYEPIRPPTRPAELPSFIQHERERFAATRLSRDARFAPLVKEQFDYACAVCRVQLEIVEAAHIIPAHDPRGRDEIWNGLALCPSHHRLFDARRFVVSPDLTIRLDFDALAFLRDSGRSEGEHLLTDFDGQRIREPLFWDRNASARERMSESLNYASGLAGLA
jgi:putative restriction endonuclease